MTLSFKASLRKMMEGRSGRTKAQYLAVSASSMGAHCSPTSSPTLGIVRFLNLHHPSGYQMESRCGLNFYFLTIHEIEPVFIYLLTINVSSSGKCLLCPLFYWLIVPSSLILLILFLFCLFLSADVISTPNVGLELTILRSRATRATG